MQRTFAAARFMGGEGASINYICNIFNPLLPLVRIQSLLIF